MIDKEAVMCEVLSLVLRANGGIEYRNGKGHPTGFFDYSGHVNTIYVSIFPDGWVSIYDEPDRPDADKFEFDFRLGEDWEILEELERLRKYVDALEEKEEQHD